MKCLICNSVEFVQKGEYFDDRYGYPNAFPLSRCKQCGHFALQVSFRPSDLTALYTEYYPRKSFDLNSYKPYQETSGLSSWLRGDKSSPFRWIPKNVKILDIGCGFGESLGYHQNRGCDVYGVEADENIRRVAKKFKFQVHIGLFEAAAYEEDSFDFVTMSQVIEHVVDPVEVLRGITKILKPGGELILSTPNVAGWGAKLFGKKWINWHAPYHLHFFSDSSLRQAAKKAGLIVERKRTITPSAWLYYQWIHLLTYPDLGRASSFWTEGGYQTKNEALGLKLLSLINKTGINHVLTRIFDSISMGDNSLYFLRKP